ncbi:MAG: hypothetical protein IJC09_05410 [Clostridia bacterium]|nr:hypothetical protein [Clostridia bacterium]
MEELFDKIKDGASKTKDAAGRLAKEVAKRTSNAITSTKLSYAINDANNKIKDIYAEIGKTIYEKYLDGEAVDSEFTDEFEKINAYMDDIEALQAKKAELKNILRCENCDTLNPATSEFCSKCGAKLTASDVADDAEDADEDVEDVITITPEKGE